MSNNEDAGSIRARFLTNIDVSTVSELYLQFHIHICITDSALQIQFDVDSAIEEAKQDERPSGLGYRAVTSTSSQSAPAYHAFTKMRVYPNIVMPTTSRPAPIPHPTVDITL